MTCVPVHTGMAYVAALLLMYMSEEVGWSMSIHSNPLTATQLVLFCLIRFREESISALSFVCGQKVVDTFHDQDQGGIH